MTVLWCLLVIVPMYCCTVSQSMDGFLAAEKAIQEDSVHLRDNQVEHSLKSVCTPKQIFNSFGLKVGKGMLLFYIYALQYRWIFKSFFLFKLFVFSYLCGNFANLFPLYRIMFIVIFSH